MSFDIHSKRKELKLTLEEVAKAVGVSKSTVKKWESGYIKNMRRDKIVKLAKVLKISPMEILQNIPCETSSAKNLSLDLSSALSQKLEKLFQSVFNTELKENYIIAVKDNKLFLLNPANQAFQNIMDLIK